MEVIQSSNRTISRWREITTELTQRLWLNRWRGEFHDLWLNLLRKRLEEISELLSIKQVGCVFFF